MVQDEMGPVAGANVVVKGTTNGNISDMDGKVVLQNVPNNSTLVISLYRLYNSGSEGQQPGNHPCEAG